MTTHMLSSIIHPVERNLRKGDKDLKINQVKETEFLGVYFIDSEPYFCLITFFPTIIASASCNYTLSPELSRAYNTLTDTSNIIYAYPFTINQIRKAHTITHSWKYNTYQMVYPSRY